MDDNILLLSIFVAVEGAHAFSAFMPSYFTVKKFTDTEGDLQKLRSGYKPAIIFNIAVGGVVSLMVKSPLPFVMSVVVIAFMLTLYENAVNEGISIQSA